LIGRLKYICKIYFPETRYSLAIGLIVILYVKAQGKMVHKETCIYKIVFQSNFGFTITYAISTYHHIAAGLDMGVCG
jgi:hypothetical protein